MRQLPIRIILARPRNPDNIGAAARAMANFGLSRLAVVAPHIPVWRETAETSATAGSGEPVWLMERARAAVGAADVIRAAEIFGTMAEAAADCALLLGTSALQRRAPNRDVVLLSDAPGYIAERLPRGRNTTIGILFGSERSGLTNEELSHCHAVLNIPTCEKQPSMNLGQAVALVCYELAGRSSAGGPRAVRPAVHLPQLREIERVVSEVLALMNGSRGKREHETEIRRALLDARMTKGAMGVLKALLNRIRVSEKFPD
jgi:tRNA/rRNA methyltransferase